MKKKSPPPAPVPSPAPVPEPAGAVPSEPSPFVDGARVLARWLDEQEATMPREPRFDGRTPAYVPEATLEAVLEAVDLSVACSPVLPPGRAWPCRCIEMENGTYLIEGWTPAYGGQGPFQANGNTWNVSAEDVRRSRARFLVMRDELYRAFLLDDFRKFPELGSYSLRERVLGTFFPAGLLVPVDEAIRELILRGGYVHADGTIEIAAEPVATTAA